MHGLSYYPAVRLSLFFIVGILSAGLFVRTGGQVSWLVAAVAVCAVAAAVFTGSEKTLLFPSFAIPCAVLLGSLAFVLRDKTVSVEWCSQSRNYCAVLQDWPVDRARSRLLKLRLVDEDGLLNGRYVNLYVPMDSSSASLVPGMALAFNGTVESPDDFDLEDGFDYAAYLHRKGVSGTLWVNAEHWRRLAVGYVGGVKLKCVRFRRVLSRMYEKWGLAGNTLAVVTAVTLADRTMLESEVRDVFSATGTSHLLAVSGLHVGILYACLSFLVPVFGGKSGRWFRESAIMLALWGYAFVIGMPPSIVRSLVMFSIASFCKCLEMENAPFNSLALAALAILVADPFAVYDTGFQLSFLAVSFILLLQPVLSELLHPESVPVKYVWDLATVSVAAQTGTAPLVAYLFLSLPTYFLLTNLIAVPVMFVIVALSLGMWMTAWISPLRMLLVHVLNCLVGWLDAALKLVSSLPGATFGVRIDSIAELAGIYLILLLVCAFLRSGRMRWMLTAAAVISVWSAVAWILS